MSSEPGPKGAGAAPLLNAEQREEILEHVWKWLWRLVGLAALIFGSIFGFGMWAAETAIEARLEAFQDVGAGDIADRLATDDSFVSKTAAKILGREVRFGIVDGDSGRPRNDPQCAGLWCSEKENGGQYRIKFNPPMPRDPVIVVSNSGSGCRNDLCVEAADRNGALILVRYQGNPVDGHFSFIAISE